MKWRQAAQELAQHQADDSLKLCIGPEEGALGSHLEVIRTIAGNSLCVTFDICSTTCSCIKQCPIKLPLWYGWFGALGCVVVAANSWLTTKAIQLTVQDMAMKLQEASRLADEYLDKF